MPSTSYNITMIESAVGNYSRPQILDVLNEICLVAFQENTIRVEKIDPLTGMPPYIATVNNVFHYTCPSDCRETAGVFTQDAKGYSPLRQNGVMVEYEWQNQLYWKVPIRQISATRGVAATLTFVDNPGDTTNKYFHHYFIRHTPLTSELIELPFPEELHYIIRDGVIQMLRGTSYAGGMGTIGPIREIISMIRSRLNKGAHPRANRTPIRDVDRDDVS